MSFPVKRSQKFPRNLPIRVKKVVLPFLEFSLVLERNHRHLNALIFLRTQADERARRTIGSGETGWFCIWSFSSASFSLVRWWRVKDCCSEWEWWILGFDSSLWLADEFSVSSIIWFMVAERFMAESREFKLFVLDDMFAFGSIVRINVVRINPTDGSLGSNKWKLLFLPFQRMFSLSGLKFRVIRVKRLKWYESYRMTHTVWLINYDE